MMVMRERLPNRREKELIHWIFIGPVLPVHEGEGSKTSQLSVSVGVSTWKEGIFV